MNVVVGVIAPGSAADVEQRMANWLVESGLDANLVTLTSPDANSLVDNVRFDCDQLTDHISALLVDNKHVSAEQRSDLEAFAKSKNVPLRFL
jgi:hypothetical protein